MTLLHRVQDNIAIISVDGYINHSNANEFEKYITAIAKEYPIVILDCSTLEYISSTGIGALVYAKRVIESSSGKIALCNCNTEVKTLLSILGLGSIDQMNSVEDAVETLQNLSVSITRKTVVQEEKEEHIAITAPPEVQHRTIRTDNVTFDHPLVIECPQCRTMVKVSAIGKYKCPDCGLQFTVDEDKTVYFEP